MRVEESKYKAGPEKKSPRILVTGATGFIGSRLLLRIRDMNPTGIGYKSKIDLVNTNCIKTDLRSENEVRAILYEYNPEVVFHLAALVLPQQNERNPQLAFESHITITENIVKHAGPHTHIIFLSTDKVFDGSEDFPNEESATNPQCLYGKLKLQCENSICGTLKQFHIIRLPIVHSNGDMASSSFIDKALVRLRAGKRVEAFNNVFRCFIKIEELLNLLEVLTYDTHYGVYHVGSAMTNYYDRTRVLCMENNIDWQDRLISKGGDALPMKQNLNTEKLEKILGYSMS